MSPADPVGPAAFDGGRPPPQPGATFPSPTAAPGWGLPTSAPQSGYGYPPPGSPPSLGEPAPYGASQPYGAPAPYGASPPYGAPAPYAPAFPSGWSPPASPYYDVDLTKPDKQQCAAAVDRLLGDEMRSLPTRLAVSNDRLHDQFDRLRSEAAFRLNVALPTAALSGILAWRYSLWCLTGIAIAVIFLWQAASRRQGANDLLIQAVITQAVRSTEVSSVTEYLVQRRRGSVPIQP